MQMFAQSPVDETVSTATATATPSLSSARQLFPAQQSRPLPSAKLGHKRSDLLKSSLTAVPSMSGPASAGLAADDSTSLGFASQQTRSAEMSMSLPNPGMMTNGNAGSGNNNNNNNNGGSGASKTVKNPSLYKTELCRSWEETGTCRYGNKCQFAHSQAELRVVERHPKYKTEMCKTFWEKGSCPYGKRCCFIHMDRLPLDGISASQKDKLPASVMRSSIHATTATTVAASAPAPLSILMFEAMSISGNNRSRPMDFQMSSSSLLASPPVSSSLSRSSRRNLGFSNNLSSSLPLHNDMDLHSHSQQQQQQQQQATHQHGYQQTLASSAALSPTTDVVTSASASPTVIPAPTFDPMSPPASPEQPATSDNMTSSSTDTLSKSALHVPLKE
eukprot:jgi/Hompol1/4594/HPOL_001792-RA